MRRGTFLFLPKLIYDKNLIITADSSPKFFSHFGFSLLYFEEGQKTVSYRITLVFVSQTNRNRKEKTAARRSLTHIQIFDFDFPLLICAQWLQLKISIVSRNRQDAHSVGVAKTTLPSLDSNNGSVGLDNLQSQSALQSKADTVVDLQKNPFNQLLKNSRYSRTLSYISLPLMSLYTARFRVPEWIASTVQVDLARGLLVPRDYKR